MLPVSVWSTSQPRLNGPFQDKQQCHHAVLAHNAHYHYHLPWRASLYEVDGTRVRRWVGFLTV